MYLIDGKPNDIYVITASVPDPSSKYGTRTVERRNIRGTSAQDVYDRCADEFDVVFSIVPDRV